MPNIVPLRLGATIAKNVNDAGYVYELSASVPAFRLPERLGGVAATAGLGGRFDGSTFEVRRNALVGMQGRTPMPYLPACLTYGLRVSLAASVSWNVGVEAAIAQHDSTTWSLSVGYTSLDGMPVLNDDTSLAYPRGHGLGLTLSAEFPVDVL